MYFLSLYLVCDKQDSFLPYISLIKAGQRSRLLLQLLYVHLVRKQNLNWPFHSVGGNLDQQYCGAALLKDRASQAVVDSGTWQKPRGRAGIPDCTQFTEGKLNALQCRMHWCLVPPGRLWGRWIFQFISIVLCSVDGHYWEDPSSLFFIASCQIFIHVDRFPPSLFFPRLNFYLYRLRSN